MWYKEERNEDQPVEARPGYTVVINDITQWLYCTELPRYESTPGRPGLSIGDTVELPLADKYGRWLESGG